MAIIAPWGTAFDLGDITPEDLLSLSTDETFSELWEGQVIQTPMTSIPHGFLAQKVGMLLAAYVQSQGLPVLIAQHALFDLTQPGQPRTVLAPDVALMQTTNLPSSMPPTYIPQGGPWLAIEILSPTQTMAQMRLKAHAYLAAGSAEVWIINPIQKVIEIHSAMGIATYSTQQPIQSAILPQFTAVVHGSHDRLNDFWSSHLAVACYAPSLRCIDGYTTRYVTHNEEREQWYGHFVLASSMNRRRHGQRG